MYNASKKVISVDFEDLNGVAKFYNQWDYHTHDVSGSGDLKYF